jgi:hypothetical protein
VGGVVAGGQQQAGEQLPDGVVAAGAQAHPAAVLVRVGLGADHHAIGRKLVDGQQRGQQF